MQLEALMLGKYGGRTTFPMFRVIDDVIYQHVVFHRHCFQGVTSCQAPSQQRWAYLRNRLFWIWVSIVEYYRHQCPLGDVFGYYRCDNSMSFFIAILICRYDHYFVRSNPHRIGPDDAIGEPVDV